MTFFCEGEVEANQPIRMPQQKIGSFTCPVPPTSQNNNRAGVIVINIGLKNVPNPIKTSKNSSVVKSKSSLSVIKENHNNEINRIAPKASSNDQQSPLVCKDVWYKKKKRLLKLHLLLIIHAQYCKNKKLDNGENSCDWPECKIMKDVLIHLKNCKKRKICDTKRHCVSTRYLLAHWKKCPEDDCSLCLPLKKELEKQFETFKKNKQNPATTGIFNEKKLFPASMAMSSSALEINLAKQCCNPEEFCIAMSEVLDKLCQQKLEILPFMMAPCVKKTGIPKNGDKLPLDFTTIRRKITERVYKDPWEFAQDLRFVFEHVIRHNRKTSRLYRYASKLTKIFEAQFEPVMRKLGYCCGNKYTFNPLVLICSSKDCLIHRNEKYFLFTKYILCVRCFNNCKEDTVTVVDEENKESVCIKKDRFEKLSNDRLEPEPFVECKVCTRLFHQICVLHLDTITPTGYVCEGCRKVCNIQMSYNKFTARQLPTTKLDSFIEKNVNMFLSNKNVGAGYVFIRVVSSSIKTAAVKEGMKSHFQQSGNLTPEFPYRSKAIMAFVEIDGSDVCFFGMHVQEYGSDCPSPNSRRVYIAYLDSVNFFKPAQYRTDVYHIIILSYLNYVKKLGFSIAHIWACPPAKGNDYIFHCHPVTQKLPTIKRLQEWYKLMLQKGIEEKIILEYKDILTQAKHDKVTSASQLPYFDGDFWPGFLEETLKELEEETRKRTAGIKADSKSRRTKRSPTQKPKVLPKIPDFSTRVFEALEQHRDSFFIVSLNSVHSSSTLPPIQDPDQLITCDLMEGRDAFLALCREKNYEFSSLRRAKYSTMAILDELHNKDRERFVFTCDACKKAIEINARFNCSICKDFDLCIGCYKKFEHMHPMDKIEPQERTFSAPETAEAQKPREESVTKSISYLVHACHCRDVNCGQPSCGQIKRVIEHSKICSKTVNVNCTTCKEVVPLYYNHSRSCTNHEKCQIPFCDLMKVKVRENRTGFRAQQINRLKRNIAGKVEQLGPPETTPCNSPLVPEIAHYSKSNHGISQVPLNYHSKHLVCSKLSPGHRIFNYFRCNKIKMQI